MLFILGLAPENLFPCFSNPLLLGIAQILNPAEWTGSANTLRDFLCVLPPGKTSIALPMFFKIWARRDGPLRLWGGMATAT